MHMAQTAVTTQDTGSDEAIANTETVLRAHRLTKIYSGNPRPALDGLDLTVNSSEIFGLLGPNGAGKTTAISVMSTLLRPSAGQVEICGIDSMRNPHAIRSRIGFVPQHIALFDRLTTRENLTYFGRIYGLKGGRLKQAVQAGLEMAGLSDRADEPVHTFSGGMKRRVNIAAGILHRPSLMFLDEPTVGIDAQSRNLIFESLINLKNQGTAMIYTTHYMEEAEQLCSRIAIIDQGRLIAQGRPARLVSRYRNCANLGDLFLRLTGRNLRDG